MASVDDEGNSLLTTMDRAHRELGALDAYMQRMPLTDLTAPQRVAYGLALCGVLAVLAAAEALSDLVDAVAVDGLDGRHTAAGTGDPGPAAG